MRRLSIRLLIVGAGLALLVLILCLLGAKTKQEDLALAVPVLAGLTLLVLLLTLLSDKPQREDAAISGVILAGLALVNVILFLGLGSSLSPSDEGMRSPPPVDENLTGGAFAATPQEVVDKMLELAQVTKDDVVYDLGCGDGRIVITAAKKYGARGVGIDIDPQRVNESLDNVANEKVGHLVEIRLGDALQVKDLERATVVTLYLVAEFNLKLRPILREKLKPGSRIVTYQYDLGDWYPDKTVRLEDKAKFKHTIYLWRINTPDQ